MMIQQSGTPGPVQTPTGTLLVPRAPSRPPQEPFWYPWPRPDPRAPPRPPGPAGSHVSVLDVLPVHQHVLPAQGPHLAPPRQDVALEHLPAVRVHLGGGHGIHTVPLERRHRVPGEKEGKPYRVRSGPSLNPIESGLDLV